MKKLLFLICIAILTDGSAQMKFLKKWDTVKFNQDSSLVFVSKGKKSALIDVTTADPIFKKSKASILPLNERDWYVKISKKGIIVYEHGSNIYKDGAEYLNGVNGFSIRRLNTDNYLVTDYGKNQFDSSGYLRLGFQKSGIYNKREKRWVIPNQYKELYTIGDFWLCKKDDSVVTVSLDEEYYLPQEVFYGSYDLFQDSGEELKKVKESIHDNHEAYQLIFGQQLFEQNETYLTIENDGQFGLIELDLFSPSENGYPFLKHDTILEVKHQFVQVAPDQSAIAFKDDKAQMHFLEWNQELEGFDEFTEVNNPFLMTKSSNDKWEKFSGEFEGMYYGGDVYKFGFFENKNQELTVINEVIFYPYQKIDEYGEPAYDWETGEILYEDDGAVFPNSGVFSLESNRWILKPEYGEIKMIPQGYLVNRYNSELMQGSEGEFDDDWCLFNQVGELEKVVEDSRFYEDVNSFIAGPEMKKVELPIQMTSQGSTNIVALFQDTASMKLLSWWTEDYYVPCEVVEAEFIYSAEPRQYRVTLDTAKNWQFMLNGKQFPLKFSDQINLMIKSPQGGECFEVSRLTENDTILVTDSVIEQCDKNRTASFFTLQQLQNGDLLINDHYRYEEEVYDYWGEHYLYFLEDSESSAIWRKTKERPWSKVTPYYAELSKTGSVFIAKSADCSGHFVYEETGEGYAQLDEYGYPVLEGEKQARYFVLDSNYKAISFLDHYDFKQIEDLGFGLSLSTDKGKMFVDYSGKAITSDEWDEFSLVEGKLKAIRYEAYLYDEYGEPAFDENFELIIAKTAAEVFFELP